MRKQTVEIRTLSEGAAFEYRGRHGRLVRLGPGSALVDIERDEEERIFVPRTGPNAGQEIRIRNGSERVTWSLASPVIPLTIN